jgi:hypothetical protein
MAITSLINPTGKPSIQDNLWHIATSDNSGQVDFKFVFDVYKGGEQLIRAKVYPNPTNGKGYFDAGPVVRNEMDYSWFNPNGTLISYEPNVSGQISQNYTIRTGEDFSGITTLNLASGNVTAYNFAAPLFKRRLEDFTAKDNKTLTDRFLNNISSNFDEDLYLPIHCDRGSDLIFSVYRYIGSSLSVSNEYGFSPSSGYFQLNISPSSIKQFLIDEADSLSIPTTTTKLIVNLETATTQYAITINVVCNGKFTPIPLHFMNSYGMFETARFELVNRLSKNLERKTFEKRDYEFNDSSVDYYSTIGSNHRYIESKINYGSKINWNYKLTMYPPSDSDYNWLSQLIDSPIIYAEIDSEYYPVTIVETNYEYSKHDFNGLKPLELNIEMNQKRFGYKR